MKVWRVLRDLSLGFLTFILDDTGVWTEYRDTNSERNFWEYPKNNKPHIFTPPRPLGSGGVKIWGLLFSWYSSSWTCDLSQFFRCFSPRRSAFIIGIHRIMIHTDQIPQSCGDTYIVCVCLVSRYQIDQFYPVSVSLIIFYAGGRYKLLHQWKMSF